jgi:hypothetical protein
MGVVESTRPITASACSSRYTQQSPHVAVQALAGCILLFSKHASTGMHNPRAADRQHERLSSFGQAHV